MVVVVVVVVTCAHVLRPHFKPFDVLLNVNKQLGHSSTTLLQAGKDFVLVPHRWLAQWRGFVNGDGNPPSDSLLQITPAPPCTCHECRHQTGDGPFTSAPSSSSSSSSSPTQVNAVPVKSLFVSRSKEEREGDLHEHGSNAVVDAVEVEVVIEREEDEEATQRQEAQRREKQSSQQTQSGAAGSDGDGANGTPVLTSWLPPPYMLEYLEGRPEHAQLIPHYGSQGKVTKSGAPQCARRSTPLWRGWWGGGVAPKTMPRRRVAAFAVGAAAFLPPGRPRLAIGSANFRFLF